MQMADHILDYYVARLNQKVIGSTSIHVYTCIYSQSPKLRILGAASTMHTYMHPECTCQAYGGDLRLISIDRFFFPGTLLICD